VDGERAPAGNAAGRAGEQGDQPHRYGPQQSRAAGAMAAGAFLRSGNARGEYAKWAEALAVILVDPGPSPTNAFSVRLGAT